MTKVRCRNITAGLRASEVTASFADFYGRTHFIRVERDCLSFERGEGFLPVGIVQYDPKSQAVLIDLPHEAETGANRLWV